MDFLRFVYVYNSFDVGSLFSYVNGVLFPCSKTVILKSEDTPFFKDYKEIHGGFNSCTNFNEYNDINHLCLVDANNLTNLQIYQLRKISTKDGVHVTILSNKFDGETETKTFKKLIKMTENEIIKKRISYACPCGTFDSEIVKEEVENSRKYEVNGNIWYTRCNINCLDDINMTEEELNSEDFELFIKQLSSINI